MGTEVIKVTADAGFVEAVRVASEALLRGGLVAFPTETVYGVGARADLPDAMARLRELKSRTDGKPFTVHVAQRRDVDQYVPGLSGLAERLVRKAFPGPLTLLLTADLVGARVLEGRDPRVADELASDGVIGVRCPDDPVASRILAAVPHPVVASSANLAGQSPPYSGDAALDDLDGRVDVLIDTGGTRYAKASTIVRVDGDRYEIVREGVYEERMIRQWALLRILFVCTGNTCRSPMAAAIARRLLAERIGCHPDDLEARGIVLESAGTFGGAGAASEHAVTVVAKRGGDLSDHRSRALSPEMLRSADHVFAMTRAHRDAALSMEPSVADRVSVLAGDMDINDPAGGSLQDYQAAADAIERALRVRLEEVSL
jgi:protein-tyrosine phosphatase